MKRILLLLCVLCCIQAPCSASTADSPMRQAMLDAIRAIDDAERTAVSTQSLESLNAAACDQVIRELGLKGKQREQFTALYVTYRDELAKAMHTEVTEAAAPGQAEQREALKTKLDNIAATARIKRDYVDKFAAILTAEQIRQLYNTEGAISTRIKRTAATRRVRETNVTGSGNIVSQSLGAAGDYSVLEVFNDIEVTVSPTATQIIVTADDNVIDWVTLDRQGGSLTLSMVEIFHSFNMRSRKGSIFHMKHQNKYLWGAMALSFVLTSAVIYIPVLSSAFGFERISALEYDVAIGLGLLVIPAVEISKWIRRKFA